MANQYLREMATAGQVLADMRSTSRAMNRSNWFRSFLTGAAIATLISLITICFFECYLFTVVYGLAVTLWPIVETLRRIEDYPQRRPSFRDLEERRPPEHFAAPLEERRDRTGIEFLCVSASWPQTRKLQRTNAHPGPPTRAQAEIRARYLYHGGPSLLWR
jgi:hypothetical protein